MPPHGPPGRQPGLGKGAPNILRVLLDDAGLGLTSPVAERYIGSSGRFVIPVVNNGKVYMATGSRSVQVYGLNPPATPAWTKAGVAVNSIAAGSDGNVYRH